MSASLYRSIRSPVSANCRPKVPSMFPPITHSSRLVMGRENPRTRMALRANGLLRVWERGRVTLAVACDIHHV
jgi:hypothetical protein